MATPELFRKIVLFTSWYGPAGAQTIARRSHVHRPPRLRSGQADGPATYVIEDAGYLLAR